MNVTKFSPLIGAEVTGVDLRQPVDSETRRKLNAAVVGWLTGRARPRSSSPRRKYGSASA